MKSPRPLTALPLSGCCTRSWAVSEPASVIIMGLPMGLLPTGVALGLILEWVLPPHPRGSHHQSRCWLVATNADSVCCFLGRQAYCALCRDGLLYRRGLKPSSHAQGLLSRLRPKSCCFVLPESYREFWMITHFQFLRASLLSSMSTLLRVHGG